MAVLLIALKLFNAEKAPVFRLSGSIRSPAILAVIKHTIVPAMNARNATSVIDCRRFGAIADKAPIIMPMELGFANPQTAKVAIEALLACKSKGII